MLNLIFLSLSVGYITLFLVFYPLRRLLRLVALLLKEVV